MAEKDKVTSESNIITPKEFEALEKKEGKKIRIKKDVEKAEPVEKKPANHDKATDIDMILLKTEKLEGRIDANAEFRESMEERLSGMNQEIGELRSSIMEKDKLIREFQSGFAKITETAEGMDSERIARQFARNEESIEKMQAEMEKVNVRLKGMRESIKDNSDVLENVRDIKNLINIIKTLKEKVDKVEEHRKFTSRTAGKIEAMFADLSDKLGEFQSYKDKIEFNEETMHEIMKTTDLIESRLGETVKKDDMKKLESSVDEKLSKASIEEDDKIYDLKRLLEDLLTGLKDAGIKGVLEKVGKANLEKVFATKDELNQLMARLEGLREAARRTAQEKVRTFPRKELPKNEPQKGEGKPRERVRPIIRDISEEVQKTMQTRTPENPVTGIRDRVDAAIDRAENAIKAGDLDSAKNLYKEALALYNQLNRAESYGDANLIYNRIRGLYTRLRIYS
jgi:chromosome segregation ATPase